MENLFFVLVLACLCVEEGDCMHIITLCSFKGGTAKTSTALHLGCALTEFYGKRVLLVDFDPQANLSIGLGLGPDQTESIVSVLQGERTIEQVTRTTCVPGLDLVPTNTYLDGVESAAPLVGDLYAHERLRKALAGLDYDFIFIDTPPSLGWLTQSAFFAAQYSVICAIPEPYSVLALKRLKDYHEAINEHHVLDVLGVLLTFWDERGATNAAFVAAIEQSFPGKLFNARVRRNISVSRAILQGAPVFHTSPGCRAGVDYKCLAEEFMQRCRQMECVPV